MYYPTWGTLLYIYMAEILPIRRKTLYNQSYNEHVIQTLFTGELITGVSAAGVGCVFFSIPNCKNILNTCTDRWTDRQTDTDKPTDKQEQHRM